MRPICGRRIIQSEPRNSCVLFFQADLNLHSIIQARFISIFRNELAPSVRIASSEPSAAMATTKYYDEKFTGQNDFGLWHLKMKVVLVQQGLADAIKSDEDFVKAVTAKEKLKETRENAHSAIIVCFSDKVLREVSKETMAAEVWAKLESLYVMKNFAHRLFSKQSL